MHMSAKVISKETTYLGAEVDVVMLDLWPFLADSLFS